MCESLSLKVEKWKLQLTINTKRHKAGENELFVSKHKLICCVFLNVGAVWGTALYIYTLLKWDGFFFYNCSSRTFIWDTKATDASVRGLCSLALNRNYWLHTKAAGKLKALRWTTETILRDANCSDPPASLWFCSQQTPVSLSLTEAQTCGWVSLMLSALWPGASKWWAGLKIWSRFLNQEVRADEKTGIWEHN